MKHCYLLSVVLDDLEEPGCMSFKEYYESKRLAENRLHQFELFFFQSRYKVYAEINKKY